MQKTEKDIIKMIYRFVKTFLNLKKECQILFCLVESYLKNTKDFINIEIGEQMDEHLTDIITMYQTEQF